MEYKNGISSIAASSSELVNASQSIGEALDTINQSLSDSSQQMDLSDLKKLEEGLGQIAGGLRETSSGLAVLKENYAAAFGALNQTMSAIPEHELSEEEIQQLYASGANQKVLDQLIETYSAARTAKGTYLAVKEAFSAVDGTLGQVSGSLSEMANHLEAMANGLSASLGNMDFADSLVQLQEGISKLASNYKAFHSGLVSYTGGVGQLSGSYSQMHNGIEDLSKGTGELENGVSKLHAGTDELAASTSDMPEQIKQEVDQMMADYDKSDFEPVSFVSTQNEKINSVQFIIKTESIKIEEQQETEKPEKEAKGFWARLKELFS